jgi:SAM-dependent methyltransferase
VYGSDIDPEAIAWAAENIPYAQVSVNPHDPPLPYDDHTFDLVFSHSVFTHMDEERQDWWLRELRRVTRVGGFLLLSVSGENAVRFLRESLEEDAEKRLQLADDVTAHLERDGIYFIPDINDPLNRGLPSWYQATFHAPWYVFEHWGRWFEIRSFIPGAALGLQDHVLLERVPDDDGRRLGLRARPVAHAMPGLKPRALDVARAAHTTEHGPSRFGRAGALARRVVLRTLRPYTAHEQKLDEHLAATIDELARVTNDHAARIAALERRSDGSP